jgi:hypothetical protein
MYFPSRERISKAMAALMSAGLISYRRQAVVVLNAAGLQAAATPSA